MRTNEIKNEIDDIKKWEEKIIRKNLKYKTNKCLYDFQQFETIRSFGYIISTAKINIYEAEIDESNLLEYMLKSDNKSKQKTNKRRQD